MPSVEALTQGLAGHGRADGETGWGAGVLVLAFAPSRFAGADAFLRQTTWLADAARRNRPRDPATPVRLPGQLAFAKKQAAERDGGAPARPGDNRRARGARRTPRRAASASPRLGWTDLDPRHGQAEPAPIRAVADIDRTARPADIEFDVERAGNLPAAAPA